MGHGLWMDYPPEVQCDIRRALQQGHESASIYHEVACAVILHHPWSSHCLVGKSGGVQRQGCIRTAVHRRRRGGYSPPPPSPRQRQTVRYRGLVPTPPLPPPLPMFEGDSQIFASAPRGFMLKIFRPAFGGDHQGTIGGGSQPNPLPLRPPPPLPYSLTYFPDQWPQKSLCTEIRPQICGPLTDFTFCRRKIFLMWVGVGGLAGAPPPPPPGGGDGLVCAAVQQGKTMN